MRLGASTSRPAPVSRTTWIGRSLPSMAGSTTMPSALVVKGTATAVAAAASAGAPTRSASTAQANRAALAGRRGKPMHPDFIVFVQFPHLVDRTSSVLHEYHDMNAAFLVKDQRRQGDQFRRRLEIAAPVQRSVAHEHLVARLGFVAVVVVAKQRRPAALADGDRFQIPRHHGD